MRVAVYDLGLMEYRQARVFQEATHDKVRSGSIESALILCSHYPAITWGKSSKKENILLGARELKGRGIALHEAARGGDVTYHGPGQLLVYPVFDLRYFNRDIRVFLRTLEEISVGLLAEFGIPAGKRAGLTGVWTGDKKIVSIGIAVKNWITYHGLAINIHKDDLFNFSLIRPCGMDISMTAMESVLGKEVAIEDVAKAAHRRFTHDESNFA